MDSKNIKLYLKKAREEIDDKDFTSAIKQCKAVLKVDRENYMALVLMGVALQGAGLKDQAHLAFRKAVQVDPDKVLAWNGLKSYYESLKQEDESGQALSEIINVYKKLLLIQRDEPRFGECFSKLASAASRSKNPTEGIKAILEIYEDNANHKQNLDKIESTILTLVNALAVIPSDCYPALKSCFLSAVSSNKSKQIKTDFYKCFIKVSHNCQEFEDLVKAAVDMHNEDPENSYPLEWIAKVTNELYIEGADDLTIDTSTYCDTVIEHSASKVLAELTTAVKLSRNGDFAGARDCLKNNILRGNPSLKHAWVLLAHVSFKLHIYEEAAAAAEKAYDLINSKGKTTSALIHRTKRIMLKSFSLCESEEKSKKAIEFCEEALQLNPDDQDALDSLVRSEIILGQLEKAREHMKSLKKSFMFESLILKRQDRKEDALKVLLDNEDDSFWYCLELGILHFDLGQYDKSVVPLLKAAKLDPDCYICFLYLGKFYEHFKNWDMARKCYQKTVRINPKCISAGVTLSNIYVKEKNWDANLRLLSFVTGGLRVFDANAINSNSQWAWLKLGLHYMETKDPDSAVVILQSMVRSRPDNGNYWETLADAYLARGAYTSALKCYQKASELNPAGIYSRTRAASIKQKLYMFPEAISEFEAILVDNPKYMPALRGLAETNLCLARTYCRQRLLGLARDYTQAALDKLTIALQCNLSISFLWKMIGDCCLMIATLPEKFSCLVVNKWLVRGNSKEQGCEQLDSKGLSRVAMQCFCQALSIWENNSGWHDLAMCYYEHSRIFKSQRETLLFRALQAAKLCTKLKPSRLSHWNILGIVAKDSNKLHIAQHAFIRAVSLQNNSAASWTNLGALYLRVGDIRLANEAFANAQRSDPEFVNGWIGQALIADFVYREEAMDLFRHSTWLEYHPQGALGYSKYVCRTLMEMERNAKLYIIDDLHAIPVACDAMTKYTETHVENYCAWNMLGILRERLGLNPLAAKAFQHASRTKVPSEKAIALANYARALSASGRRKQAIQVYRSIEEPTFWTECGLAWTLYKDKQYEESYGSYKTALDQLTEDANLQSHVLVALAGMTCIIQGPTAAKTLLFQSTQLQPPSEWGLYATLSVALLENDLHLADLVLQELNHIRNLPEIRHHCSVLSAYTTLLKEGSEAAITELNVSACNHWRDGSTWLSLAVFILLYSNGSDALRAASYALEAMTLDSSTVDFSKAFCVASLAYIRGNKPEEALLTAQKAIHLYPHTTENWATIIFILKVAKIEKVPLHFIDKFAKNRLAASKRLKAWLKIATRG